MISVLDHDYTAPPLTTSIKSFIEELDALDLGKHFLLRLNGNYELCARTWQFNRKWLLSFSSFSQKQVVTMNADIDIPTYIIAGNRSIDFIRLYIDKNWKPEVDIAFKLADVLAIIKTRLTEIAEELKQVGLSETDAGLVFAIESTCGYIKPVSYWSDYLELNFTLEHFLIFDGNSLSRKELEEYKDIPIEWLDKMWGAAADE